jgi:hypothetical protein
VSVTWVVLTLGYGLEFCAASVRGEWERAGISFLAMLILTAGIVHRKRLKAWVARTSPNWVFAAFLALLLAVALLPYVEQRRLPFAGWLTPMPNVATWDGGPAYEGTPLGWNWKDWTLSGTQQQDKTIALNQIWILGKNVGTAEVELHEAYLVSAIDGTPLPLKVITPEGAVPISDVGKVPVGAEVKLTGYFDENGQPLTDSKFLRRWESFAVVVTYDQTKIRHEINAEETRSRLVAMDPYRQPHISPKR